MEKIAIIDLGTNTFHLLIAEIEEGKAKIVFKDKASVKIGQGGISMSFINSDAYNRALKTLSGFKEIMEVHGVKEVYALGTSAVRNARNGYEFVKDIKKRTGIDIKIISGEKEAEFIYNGVKYGMNLGRNTSVIMDIGGGSVEFIICNQDTILWKKSFEIGAQRLLDRFHTSDPITEEETENLLQYLDEKLNPLFEASAQLKPLTLVGSSGTFDTLCDIDVIRKGLDFIIEEEVEYTLALHDFYKIASDIIHKNKEERMQIAGMMEMRVDMIVVACLLIQLILERLQIQKIRVCSYSLKEGVLNKILQGEAIEADRGETTDQ